MPAPKMNPTYGRGNTGSALLKLRSERSGPGARLTALRKQLGFSQMKMSEVLGIPAHSLPQYELNKYPIPEWIMAKVAEAGL